MEALIGAAEVEVMELEAPVGAEGEVGDDVVADAGTDTGEVGGFWLAGNGPFGPSDAVIEKEEKLEGVVKLLPAGKGIKDAHRGRAELEVHEKNFVAINDPLFVTSHGIISSKSILFRREKVIRGDLSP